jgi:hypothetical protein
VAQAVAGAVDGGAFAEAEEPVEVRGGQDVVRCV